MAKNKKNLIELSTSELARRRTELKEEALMMRVQKEAGQLENPSRLRLNRREIARIETVLTTRKGAQS